MKRTVRYCPQCGRSIARRGRQKRPTCLECGWVDYHNPLPCVAALVQNRQGEILLVRRGVPPAKHEWALPSGFIETGETPERAVVRELKEETNLTGRVGRLIGVYRERTQTYGDVLVIGYEIEHCTGHVRAGSDTCAVKFFPPDNLSPVPFPSHRAVIRDARAGRQREAGGFIEVLKSKIQEAVVTQTKLDYAGSIGLDGAVMEGAGIIPGEKVLVLNCNNGERLETYVIREKKGSGRIVLVGPAARKASIGDRICILGYLTADIKTARRIIARVRCLDKRNNMNGRT